MNRKNLNRQVIKLKRAGLFFLGLSLFLVPGHNYYAALAFEYQPAMVRTISLSLPEVALFPSQITAEPAPRLTAKTAVVIDRSSAAIIYGKDENLTLLPASTSKIMTALVAMDQYKLSDILTVQQVRNFGQDMELVFGEQLTFKNLLAGVLIYSANDAAWVLAQNYPGGETAFVQAMNQKAKQLHLNNSYFANPTGVNSDDNGRFLADFSYTTSLDLARLTNEALKNPLLAELVSTKQMTVTDVTGIYRHQLFNLNELLGSLEGVKGVKTGWTEDAQGCLVAYTKRDGREIISVVLGSADRFGESKRLINWVYNNYAWQEINPIVEQSSLD